MLTVANAGVLVKSFPTLANLPRWITWLPQQRKGKSSKVPHSGSSALSTNKPEHWQTLHDALRRAEQVDSLGVGLVLTGGIDASVDLEWIALDLDHAVGNPAAQDLIEQIGGYWEISPSGQGYRGLGTAPKRLAHDIGHGSTVRGVAIEVYRGDSARFVTLTGDTLPGHEVPGPLDAGLLLELMGAQRSTPLSRRTRESVDMPEGEGQPVDVARVCAPVSQEESDLIEGALPEGGRSEIVFGLLCKLARAGVSPEDSLASALQTRGLQAYYLSKRGDDPERAALLAWQDVLRAKSKAGDDGLAALASALGGAAPPAALAGARSDEVRLPATPPSRGPLRARRRPFPTDLVDQAPREVAEVYAALMRMSGTPRAEFAYACALSIVALARGRMTVVGPQRTRLNLFIALVGGTGTGKSQMLGAMQRLLSETAWRTVVADFPASEAAMRRALTERGSMHIIADELSHKLEAISDDSTNQLMRALLQAFSQDYIPEKHYSDAKKSLPEVRDPYVQIAGGATPRIWQSFQQRHAEEGLISRFLFVQLPEVAKYVEPTEVEQVPAGLAARFNLSADVFDSFRAGQHPIKKHLPFSDEVTAEAAAYSRKLWFLLNGEGGLFWSRAAEYITKIAGVLALSAGAPAVRLIDWQQARSFVEWCIAGVLDQTGDLSDSPGYAQAARAQRLLEKAGGSLGRRDLLRAMKVGADELGKILATMVAADWVEIDQSRSASGRVITTVNLVGAVTTVSDASLKNGDTW